MVVKMEVFIEPKDYTIDFPQQETKYPAAIMRFMDHKGGQVTLKMSQEKFEEFILRLNRKVER